MPYAYLTYLLIFGERSARWELQVADLIRAAAGLEALGPPEWKGEMGNLCHMTARFNR